MQENPIRRWAWTLDGVDSTYRGTGDNSVTAKGDMWGEYLGEALLAFVNRWEGLELLDDEAPFTLTVTPVGDDPPSEERT